MVLSFIKDVKIILSVERHRHKLLFYAWNCTPFFSTVIKSIILKSLLLWIQYLYHVCTLKILSKLKIQSSVKIKKSRRYFYFLRPVLPNGFLSCVCFFDYMFFPSYLVAGSFKSKLIRKRVLRNHAGFLGYQFFVFLISIISDYII